MGRFEEQPHCADGGVFVRQRDVPRRSELTEAPICKRAHRNCRSLCQPEAGFELNIHGRDEILTLFGGVDKV